MPVGIFYPLRGTEAPEGPDLFPNLPGIMWQTEKIPNFNTSIQPAFSGIETRVGYMALPRWTWKLKYDCLRSSPVEQEQQALLGFFLAHLGAQSNFLYEDLSDNYVSGQLIGQGDGVSTDFQLVRSFQNIFTEPIFEINDQPTMYLDGVASAAWQLLPKGIVRFNAAPAAGAVITADFYYFFRVRFNADQTSFRNLWLGMWDNQDLELISVLGES